jgi:hypothetical protein
MFFFSLHLTHNNNKKPHLHSAFVSFPSVSVHHAFPAFSATFQIGIHEYRMFYFQANSGFLPMEAFHYFPTGFPGPGMGLSSLPHPGFVLPDRTF